MSDVEQVYIARAIAHLAHKGQVDKSGNPYIDHPNRVVAILQRANSTNELLAAGWLHDVLEDSEFTAADLLEAGVSPSIVQLVQSVTRVSGVSVEKYYEGIATSYDSRRLKRADIEDNTDLRRLALLDDATIVRLVRKYAKAKRLIEGGK